MSERLQIEKLGAQGDGVATTPKGQVFVPFALPGETVTVEIKGQRASLLEVNEPSPLRVAPKSVHFGRCGGCSIQHLDPESYAEWKREKVVRALAMAGVEAEVDALVVSPPASRRRVTLSAQRIGGRVQLGFNAAYSHDIVEIQECAVAAPQIVAALPELRQLATLLASGPKPFRLTVTYTRTGLDIAAEDVGKIDEGKRRRLVEFCLGKGFARLSSEGETIIEREKPVVMFGNVPVTIPPGGFLQATEHAEHVMASLVQEHLAGSKYVADLFAGSGTFALRLATASRVHAVESEGTALAALDEAAKRASGLKPVVAEKRDLFRRPLTEKELVAFDGLAFDPPRAGAEAQCEQIARSTVRRVAAVSCNPGTLARDLAILTQGGYRVTRVVPVDQFLWTSHVEVVALLEKPRKRN
ncbi:RNA methyltransferase [Nitratireductor aestuarii]|uniref:RNA methyltransferase n=1 Tax=Nitratireductor aestuarii TaxID=1735103 RepID=A0A916RXS2_9HYPH|nr:class I SAM-dependent RNA methyltransferase [Nitratireductor aestuarii]GGA72576.1 RNA methyltransferase [Nitratireductor aestuarii]